ncbi:Uncharacterised 5xTM membrane BCR, YitT family COG1284 [Bacillus sp. OV322]|uniref:YitT family protein n=1 Tax=Bacillus sp. OV322 TaxID=1882764 RepID=UPI0008F3677A|nr:YitT family protein [Bacillus sp. OV322]SFC36005.1 Uncharacterised 5xTM membrane BCR, YitT family COG1284 [Bacillus sp. OV322]
MIRKICIALLSSIFIGVGLNGFVIPYHLLNGGIWGVSLILHYVMNYNVALVFICLNAPIFLAASFYDKSYFVNGMAGVVISSTVIDLLKPFQTLIHLPVLYSVLIGGTLIGIGVGCMLKEHISPGGMDLLALIMAKVFSVNVGIIILVIDAVIILTGILILKDASLLYSMLIIGIVGTMASIITGVRNVNIYV